MTTDELLQRWSDGSITTEELRELTAKLAEPEHQSALLDDWLLESSLPDRLPGAAVAGLRASETSRSVERMDSVRARQWTGWLSWRPLTAAAAGLVFGLFSASMVWAYAVPLTRGTIEQVVSVFVDGFEDAQTTPRGGFPKQPNEWTGDLSAPVGAESEVKPIEGKRMLRLIPTPKRKFSYARRIMNLAEYPPVSDGQTRRLEVTASFNTPDTERSSHYQIRLAAFTEAPGDLRAIWNDEPMLFDTVLQHVGRNVRTEPGDSGWQTVSAILDLPPGTRSVVISLAAAEADPTVPPTDHFLDDVEARFVITQAPLD